MPDVDLRQLERDAAQGDLGAQERLLRERARRGQIDEEHLSLAAYLGYPAAQALRSHEAVRADPDHCAWYVDGLARWGRKIMVFALHALAQSRLPVQRSAVTLIPSESAPFPLYPGASALIGRTKQCNLRFQNEALSREHCRIWIDALGDIRAKDLGSTNGTWLGGSPISSTQSTVLRGGDRLELGRITLEVRVDARAGPLRDCLTAIGAWLEEPTEPALVAVAGAEAMLSASQEPDPTTQRIALACAEAVRVVPPGIYIRGHRLQGCSDYLATIRRALLPLALSPDPLPTAPRPEIPDTSHPAQVILDFAAENLQSGWGLELVQDLGSSGDLPAHLARGPDGALTRMTFVLRDPMGELVHSRYEAFSRLAAIGPDRLQHPKIQRLLECRELDSVGSIQVEHVGTSLRRAPPESPAEAVALLRELAPGIHHAGQHLAVLVSANHIFRSSTGPVFNAAEAAVPYGIDRMSSHQLELIGGWAPEYLDDWASLRHPPGRCYCLASTLYWCLTGKPVFEANRRADLFRRMARHRIPTVPHVSAALNAVLQRGLAQEPQARYANAVAFADALGETPEGRA